MNNIYLQEKIKWLRENIGYLYFNPVEEYTDEDLLAFYVQDLECKVKDLAEQNEKLSSFLHNR